ncbi:NACHT, LRR and PYD domains-containing protein 3-like isoform X1 [Centroberyx gerrardi]
MSHRGKTSKRKRSHPDGPDTGKKARLTEVQKMSEEERGSVSPAGSCTSMQSDHSRKELNPDFSNEPGPSGTNTPEKGTASPSPSCLSLKSSKSMEYTPNFREEDLSDFSDWTTPCGEQDQDTLKVFETKAMAFLKQALRGHKKVLTEKHKELSEEEQEEVDDDEPVESDAETNEAALKIALHILKTMNKNELADTLEQNHYGELIMYQRKLKASLKRKYESLLGEITKQRHALPLKKIYTELHVIEGDSGEINNEHEVREIETAFNRPRTLETPIKCEDIFRPLPRQAKPIRTVLTKGIAGIGKTMLTQKFMLDWSEENANQDIQLLFSLPFRELNLLKMEKRSLMELCDLSIELEASGIKDLERYSVLFVLDGLDECRLPLDFQGNERCCDATQSASVDVLLTNLISGNLLPKARLWITSRPAAAGCIPPQYIDLVTEVQGFNDPQKEQYFNKKIDDVKLARRVITHIKSTRSLYIMCHVPVFCWISSIVLRKMCAESEKREMPKTLTQMYIHFLAFQTTQMHLKYREQLELDSQRSNKIMMSLGKLAFQQLEKGNLIFYEEDLRNCGIDVREASVYSGVCTQVFREEPLLRHKVFCFVHLSIQEFLAALYVYLMFRIHGVNLMIKHGTSTEPQMSKPTPVAGLHKAAVDRALQSDNGHLDLFLRFLLGLSLESNQALFRDLIQVEARGSHSPEETIMYIKEKIRENPHPERCINLFHCLNELNDHSLEEEIQNYLGSERDSVMDRCSPAQWSALVFVLLTSEEKLEEFDLKKYSKTEEGLLRLLPVVKASRSAMLNDCSLTGSCCEALSSTLSSTSCELRDLNLSDNNLEDSGIELLCIGLRSPYCRLKTLRLNRCGLTQRCCEKLASVLSCRSHLRELDLSDNDIEDSGVKLLSTGLGNLRCKLEALRLSFCSITEEGCGFLASAVRSNPSHLRELDLSYNHPGDSGVKLISEALEEAHCDLTKLSVGHNAECWLKSGLRKYACELTVDPNTAHKLLILSDGNRKVTQGREEQPYPDHPDRFDYWTQVLFQEGLTGRCYWEAEWEGNWAGLGVAYKGISRKGVGNDCVMGYNPLSWGLHCSAHGYHAYHNFKSIPLQVPLAGSRRLAIYLDWPAGILSFYRVSSGRSLTHLHTFYTTFTEPLYPVFKVWDYGSSMRLCQVK